MNYLILIIIIVSFNDIKSFVTLKKTQTTTKKNVLKNCYDFQIAYNNNNMQTNPNVVPLQDISIKYKNLILFKKI